MVLEGLDNVEVRTFAFREAVLAVELELGSDHRVLTPAVHVEGSLGENEGSRIRDVRTGFAAGADSLEDTSSVGNTPITSGESGSGGGGVVDGTRHLEETRGVDEGIGSGGFGRATESVDGVGKSIDGIGVVEGLSTEGSVEGRTTLQGSAVVNVGIRLDNPDQLLAGVVEVELDLVGRGTD